MRSGRITMFVVFVLNGVIAGSWAPRIPTLANRIGASPGVLGLVLFGASLGLATSAPFAGRLCARLGARVLVFWSAVVAAGVLPVLALVATPLQLGLALVVLGAAFGMFDVSINVAAVTVIRRFERPLMPLFHAAFSFGAMAGSVTAAFTAAHGVRLLPYFSMVFVASLVVALAVRPFVPREKPAGATTAPARLDRGILRRPVLWLLAAVVFCSAVVEGSNGDWAALFAVRERGLSPAAGALMYSVFTLAMAVVRLAGERLQRRFGAVRLLVAGPLLAGGGLLAAAIVPIVAVTYAGYVLAGAGVGLAFPVVLDLVGAVSRRADGTGGERELGLVTGIAYSGFLIGPPMLGGVAQLTNLSFSVGVVGFIAMLMAPAALASAAARRREKQPDPDVSLAA